MSRPNTPVNANQRKKSTAVAAPKGSGSKKKVANKSFNPSSIPSSRSLDARREDSETFPEGDTQRDEDTGAQSMLLKYNEIRGG
jgi:hypothetical protein